MPMYIRAISCFVQRTVMLKAAASPEQFRAVRRTIFAFNAACNYAAQTAFREQVCNNFRLHKLLYRDLRSRFALSAQMAVRCVAKVCEAYKRDKTIQPVFREQGAVPYDERILSWKSEDRVSLLTLEGRILVPLRLGDFQRTRLASGKRRGQCDVLIRKACIYISVCIKEVEPIPTEPVGFLGVDLGVKNLAVDSDGTTHTGKTVETVRLRLHCLTRSLQAKGTRSAKRHLRRLAGREARFRRNTNHILSKALVVRAKDTQRGLALEDLKGISIGTTVRRRQRRRHKSWAFNQLRAYAAYKAAMAGVVLVLVDPRNTSRTCPDCLQCAKENRKTRDNFKCVACGLAGPSDHIAARNIAAKAAVKRPIVSGNRPLHSVEVPRCKPPISIGGI